MFVLALATSLAAAAPTEDAQALMTGMWVATESSEALSATRDAAMEKAIAQMSFYMRPFAYSRLAEAGNTCDTYELALTADTLSWQCDARTKNTRKLDNSSPPGTNAAGNPVDITMWVNDADIKIRWGDEDGNRTNLMTFSGDTMTLRSAIKSPNLPEDMVWTATYKRK